MSSKIGHFEILSELAKSATGTVYKATDPQNGQTVALKAIQLSAFGAQAPELETSLVAEAENSKVLSHSNLPPIYGAGKIEGQFCAAMEYIQGNSIATMLARKEGFSIWDLLDIGRQITSGLDHAHSHKVFHYSLEPAKIMCGWDGGVRVLSFGMSSVGRYTLQVPGVPPILYYMSPEQIRGEQIDARSNLFSLGAMFYEMVTDQKPFDCEDSETLRQIIVENGPTPPIELNPKIHPALSDLILKALSKDPNERYQSGRELLDDLEKCKETKPQAAKAAAPKGTMVPDAVKAANQAKFIGASTAAKPVAAAAKPTVARPAVAASRPTAPAAKTAATPVAAKQAAPASARPATPPAHARPTTAQTAQSKTVSAGSTGTAARMAPAAPVKPQRPVAPPAPEPELELDEPGFAAPQAAAPAPKIAVDPLMAGEAPSGGSGLSFSEMTELPPLKEVYVEPPAPSAQEFEEPVSHSHAAPTVFQHGEPEKPKVQPREIAEKAVKEIKNVPPRLIIYSIAGAAVVILAIAIGLVMHINSLNSEGESSSPAAAAPVVQTPAQPPASQPAAVAQPAQPAPAPAATPFEPAAEPANAEPETRAAAPTRGRNARRKAAPAAPAIVPGELAIDSNPQGAQVQIDGRSDPSWVTPVTLSGVATGQHSIVVSKSGYITDSRNVNVASGSRAFVSTRLNQLTATLAVSSSPAGADVYIDGKNTGRVTPAQVAVTTAGSHVVLVRKSGYIDETTSAQFALGQTVSFTPTLRALGNVDDMRTTGKMKKLFGGKDAQGMGTLSVHTQPKGAQVAVNEHMLDKDSPVEVLLDPGNYVVDVTMTGYAPIHKVISVDKGGKVVIDEVMQRQ
jgi:hypothetical protein